MTWVWPLPGVQLEIPKAPHPGAFGVRRKFDVHTGVDLYCNDGHPIVAVEDGVVVATEWFTGQHTNSPWWEDTRAVLVQGQSGVICYGELIETVHVGEHIVAGQVVGHVKRVLRKDKGRPMSMLHLELYAVGTTKTETWHLDVEKPQKLLDPTDSLMTALPRKDG